MKKRNRIGGQLSKEEYDDQEDDNDGFEVILYIY
jgi:hypothetical protein